ncbi:MAG: ImmA/IrrE family metallo-endopeptidase [Alphaproteobacteria bacterium]|nr:ImmA/IrrE family metallo-endopeptidase [Burkholderiaceae bacterium]MBY0292125.1 ImmA/IrrE family metallo-endopeptidase [Alphaproteobacteria bacterium]
MNVPVSIEIEVARSMLDKLLEDSRLYRKGADYKNLLDFAVRLRNFAPFNALLLQIQKPGLNHAASASEWFESFGRTIKVDARPLLILWPFGPVALVYDLMDTEGEPIPEGVTAFAATGVIDQMALARFELLLAKKNIAWMKLDAGDCKAGSIALVKRSTKSTESSSYSMNVNKNHDANVQFSTLAHELAHLFLGHLGRDVYLSIPQRPTQTHAQQELEAESTAFIVCARNGVECKSQSYLASYVKQDTSTEQLDLYQIMRAAGQIETILGLTTHTKLKRPKKKGSETLPLFPEDMPTMTDLFATSD